MAGYWEKDDLLPPDGSWKKVWRYFSHEHGDYIWGIFCHVWEGEYYYMSNLLIDDVWDYGWGAVDHPSLEGAKAIVESWMDIYGDEVPRKIIPFKKQK